MKVVALVKPPQDLALAAKALADLSGTTLAEARMRLAPEPPALLARLDDEEARALASGLRDAGLAALAVGTRARERLVVRGVDPSPERLLLRPRLGEPMELAWDDLAAILRGASSARSETESTQKTRQLDVTGALATGGLKLTKTRESTVRTHTEEIEQSIYLVAHDGREAVLREHGLEFAWLGKELSPSRTANMTTIATMFRQRAPRAFFDDRLLRLGRRPIPFLAAGESQVVGPKFSTVRQDTGSVLDLLAEVMFEAVAARLLP